MKHTTSEVNLMVSLQPFSEMCISAIGRRRHQYDQLLEKRRCDLSLSPKTTVGHLQEL